MKHILAIAISCCILTVLAQDAEARFGNPAQLLQLADDGCNVQQRVYQMGNPSELIVFPSNRCLCSFTKCVAYYIGDDGGTGMRYAEDNIKRCNPLPAHPYSIQDICHMMSPGDICEYLDTESPCDWNPGVGGTTESGGSNR